MDANGRIARLGTYIEPNLHTMAQQEAASQGKSVSNYLRELVINDLIAKEKIDHKTLVELAVK